MWPFKKFNFNFKFLLSLHQFPGIKDNIMNHLSFLVTKSFIIAIIHTMNVKWRRIISESLMKEISIRSGHYSIYLTKRPFYKKCTFKIKPSWQIDLHENENAFSDDLKNVIFCNLIKTMKKKGKLFALPNIKFFLFFAITK